MEWHTYLAQNQGSKSSNLLSHTILAEQSNGKTGDFDSSYIGSIPVSAANWFIALIHNELCALKFILKMAA